MKEKLPNHIGIIPDGVRRWADLKKCSYLEAYKLGIRKVVEMLVFYLEKGVPACSVYMLSSDNLSRDEGSLEPVLLLEEEFIRVEMPKLAEHYSIKVIHAGNLKGISSGFSEAILDLCKHTYNNKKHRLYLLIDYNPKDELQNSFNKSQQPADILKNLWVPEAVDLVIRTSGEHRTSNFLPLQISNAELVLESKFINDTNDADFQRYLDEYFKRKRRHGL